MTKSFTGLVVLTLAMGLGFFVTPSYAQENANQGASQPDATSGGDTTKDETLLEKLEEDFKETTTPTDKETDPIGTNEDADHDLY